MFDRSEAWTVTADSLVSKRQELAADRPRAAGPGAGDDRRRPPRVRGRPGTQPLKATWDIRPSGARMTAARSATLRPMPDPSAERRLRAAAVLARDDAGAAGPARAAAPRFGGRRRGRRRLHGRSPRPASSPGAAPRSRSSRRRRLGFGGSTRNGGIVHPGYKWGPRDADQALRRGDRPRAVPRHARCVRARQAADRRRGASTASSASAATSTSRTAPSHVGDLIEAGRDARRLRRRRRVRATRAAPRGDRQRTRITAGSPWPRSGLLHPGKYFAGLAAAAERAGADLHEGVRARDDPPPGGRAVRRRDRPRRDPREGGRRRDERLHGRARPVAPPPDHPDRQLHHRDRAAPGGPRPRALAEGPGVLRHEELPLLLARLGRPADGLRRAGQLPADVGRPDRGDPPQGDARGPSAARRATASTTRGAATSASRSIGCRTSGGWTA